MEPQISGRAVGPEGSSPAVRTRDSPDPAGNRGRLMIFISDLEEIWSERPRPGLQNAADPAKRGPPERWPSGLRRTLGKRVCGKPYRGFESHSLRQQYLLNYCIIKFIFRILQIGPQFGPQLRAVVRPSEPRIVSTAGCHTRKKGRGPTMHIHQAGWLALAAIAVSGCGPTLSERNWADAQRQCQLRTSKEQQQESFDDCVRNNYRAYDILSRYTPPTVPSVPSSGPATTVVSPSSLDNQAPAPNIIPPTVRCQSVGAGLGTVQTVCH